mmetsp:Transcript_14351/g.40846  ORF Transcript_14351/g.40846 Transcript_14351/m.40846 type:complete len:102 (+) Transcript_14351:921-1226(+)|eukprot:CAMPEP_0119569630 /NCGR_PEP_ID=MMETSP1352-20130426/42204_1 /TAXON_ID=265584 /ORGANISM="Stauroneis constricta, Strain CCMP1120" /LENGTH=101 /DNA_ID=CAMNT_0007619211 /DNA_START=864 /DNA_END=1169 /DNA_ORIENTATION=+
MSCQGGLLSSKPLQKVGGRADQILGDDPEFSHCNRRDKKPILPQKDGGDGGPATVMIDDTNSEEEGRGHAGLMSNHDGEDTARPDVVARRFAIIATQLLMK